MKEIYQRNERRKIYLKEENTRKGLYQCFPATTLGINGTPGALIKCSQQFKIPQLF